MSSEVRGDGAGRVAGVLARYPESQLLQISGSERTELYRSTEQGDLQERVLGRSCTGAGDGAGRLAGDGAGRLAGALGQCPALAHLNLSDIQMGAQGAGRQERWGSAQGWLTLISI
jgi:hypothetical protein